MIEALFNLSAFDRRGNEIGAPRNLADVKFWGNLTAGIAKIPLKKSPSKRVTKFTSDLFDTFGIMIQKRWLPDSILSI
jgi:hypothetical protein